MNKKLKNKGERNLVISLIAAVDSQMGIGRNNQLLCHLPADLAHFKAITMGKPIVMGRKTFESIGKPLPGRLNLVLSHQGLTHEGIVVASSLSEVFVLTKNYPEVCIIGGSTVYDQALPHASRIYLTYIHAQLDADVFFPELDKAEWECVESMDRPRCDKNPYDLTFCRYEKR